VGDSLKLQIKKDVTSQAIKVGASASDARREISIKTSLCDVSPLWSLPADIGVSVNPHIGAL
jgi:hypothetical protein